MGTETSKYAGHSPEGAEWSEDGQLLYIPSTNGNSIHLISIRSHMLEHCGYLSINNADRLLFQDAPLILRERDEAREQLGEMVKALAPLVAIANRYDDNGLDDEARKFWGKNDEFKNDKKPSDIELYSGRGGKQLLVLADCLTAREIVSKHTTTKGGSQS